MSAPAWPARASTRVAHQRAALSRRLRISPAKRSARPWTSPQAAAAARASGPGGAPRQRRLDPRKAQLGKVLAALSGPHLMGYRCRESAFLMRVAAGVAHEEPGLTLLVEHDGDRRTVQRTNNQ